MTLGEALGELGAAQNATADEVRRAYLRLVKTRKPETDPEGFRRLRDAYEVVQAYLHARGPLAGGATASPVPTRQPVEPSQPEVAPAPDAVASAAPVTGTPLAAEQDGEIAELLEIQTLIANDSIGKAADRLETVYERAATNPQALLPDPRVTIGLVLQLHLKGRPKSARSLDTSFRRWLKATDSEVKILAGPVAARWALCKELGDVPAGLSPRVRTVIARLALEGELAVALSHLAHYREQDPIAAGRDAELLRRNGGPNALKLAQELSPPPRQTRTFRPWWVVALAVMVLRGASSLFSSSPGAPPPSTEVDKAALFSARMDRLRGSTERLKQEAVEAGDTHLAEGARRLSNDLASSDCGDALLHAKDLVPADSAPSALRIHCDRVGSDVLAACSLASGSVR